MPRALPSSTSCGPRAFRPPPWMAAIWLTGGAGFPMLDFDRRELLDLFRILPVMRQGAIALGNAGDRWHNKIPLGLERDPLGG
ncbi:MAG: hypothetical protein ACK56I_21935, partial [bacterium]